MYTGWSISKTKIFPRDELPESCVYLADNKKGLALHEAAAGDFKLFLEHEGEYISQQGIDAVHGRMDGQRLGGA